MNLDLETADRDVYNMLDWVKEIGGLLKGLRMIFSLVVLVLTYKNFETFMISHLFQSPEQA